MLRVGNFQSLSDGKKSAKLTIDNSGPKTLSIGLKGTGKGNAVATATATATATPTPTATPTAAACPNPSPGACPSSGAPSATSLIPSSAVAGGPDIPLAICGCNLTSSTTARWNGVAQSTQFISSNQINTNISAADLSNVGVDNVTVGAGSQVSSPQTFFVGSSGGNGYAELVIDQQANDIVNDPLNQVIYMSVPGAAATNGNTISVIDLATGQITSSQFAGSNPDVLAISDDGQFLYAGIDGAASVQRFILPSLTNDISIALGRSQFDGPYYALDIQVAPGAPHTTALTLANFGFSPSADYGIAIFDDATQRPTIAKGRFNGGEALYDSLQWGSDATALYASNFEDSGFDFYTLSVNSSGVSLDNDYPGTFSSYSSRIHFDRGTGLIYGDNGQVVNPVTANPVGSYTTSPAAVMVPDSSLDRAFFVSSFGGSGGTTIQAFDLTHFTSIGSITIPNATDDPVRIIRWGSNGLAFATHQGPVYLVGGNFVH